MALSRKNSAMAGLQIFYHTVTIIVTILAVSAQKRLPLKSDIDLCPEGCKCSSPVVANCVEASIKNNSNFWNDLNPKVEDLNIAKNDLRHLPNELARYSDIVILNLSENNIAEITNDVLKALRKLVVLDLSRNRIKFLSAIRASVLIVANGRLQVLNLSHNPIVNLGNSYEEILCSTSLTSLDVSFCDISYLQGPMSLQGMPHLKHLNLSSNPLSMLDGLTSSSVETLDVTNCTVQVVRPDTFSQMHSLKELYASQNVRLSGQFRLVSQTIEIVQAAGCILDTLYVSELPYVRKISLRRNRFKEIPQRSFERNEQLEELDLAENDINWISEFAFSGTIALKYVDLSSNQLKDLSDLTFTFNPNLATLNLSHNYLTDLPQLHAPSVETLDLSHCRIETIRENALMYAVSLKRLNLSYNLLEGLPRSLSSQHLLEINLSFCRLLTINSSALYNLPLLTDLDLTGNRLVYIRNSSHFSQMRNLERIRLENNPWSCDCTDGNFRTLWHFVYNLSDGVDQLNRMDCLSPPNMTGLRWSIACDKAWRVQTKNAKDLILLCAVLGVLLLCGMLACAVGYKKKLSASADEIGRRIAGSNVTPARNGSSNGVDEAALEERRSSMAGSDSITQTIQKLSKLPSYDEALLLPQISVEDVLNKSRKRQSGTQTDETMETLMNEVKKNKKSDADQTNRHSMQEIEYMNLPAPIQCTEL